MIADPGRMLGKYQLIAEIARGGMGVVYLAMVRGPGGFNKLVVVKELKPELIEEPAFLTMFLDEARLAARLSHPNIVQTNEVGNEGDRYFMAMDYLDGRGLDHVRRRSRSAGFGLTLHMHLRVICDVLSGLDYAHKLSDFDGTRLNIVHRDVSPQNVFLTFDGQVKLLDFGIAKAADSMHETNVGVVKGKVSYMSPEQARGQKVDARADVFSSGVLLWEALTGKRLRDGKNEQEKLWSLVSEDIPRASKIKPVPHELDEICARAMAWDRDERYLSCGAMQHDLEAYLTDAGSHVSSRDVGLCVSELFREDRVTTNAVIEAHVARARGGGGREQLPIIDVARLGSSPGLGTPSGTPSSVRALSSADNAGVRTSHDLPSSRARSASHLTSPPDMPHAVVERPRRRRAGWIAAGLAAAAIAGGATVLAMQASPSAASKPPVVPSPPPIVTPPPPPPPAARPVEKPATVAIEVRVSPDNATISIDGEEVQGNPFAGQYTSDNIVHHIRASAPGYVTKSRAVTFASNVTLDVSLERAEVAAPPPVRPVRGRGTRIGAGTSAPVAAPPPAPATNDSKPSGSDIDPNGGAKPKRPIDLDNPYGGAQ